MVPGWHCSHLLRESGYERGSRDILNSKMTDISFGGLGRVDRERRTVELLDRRTGGAGPGDSLAGNATRPSTSSLRTRLLRFIHLVSVAKLFLFEQPGAQEWVATALITCLPQLAAYTSGISLSSRFLLFLGVSKGSSSSIRFEYPIRVVYNV